MRFRPRPVQGKQGGYGASMILAAATIVVCAVVVGPDRPPCRTSKSSPTIPTETQPLPAVFIGDASTAGPSPWVQQVAAAKGRAPETLGAGDVGCTNAADGNLPFFEDDPARFRAESRPPSTSSPARHPARSS
ncbi:hypothetical protein [Nakamurella leprariae]|uniref:Uncharacterized protein n=1 Tax=Nakamurella leprariae TaxID=2803911 RepID=A0A939C385_9ACTN|nr:hypothetical protein [Nakamurella leprariae]MBM9469134.1 hypothetical protein [Nakamurella leprariae]